MATAFVIINASGAGGAEKRFSRCFLRLREQSADRYHLLLNESLWRELVRQGVPLDRADGVEVLPELGWLSKERATSRRAQLAAYVPTCLLRLRRLRVDVVHLIGNGVYVGLPLLHLRGYGVVISIYDSALDSAVSTAMRPLYRHALQYADAIDVLSEAIRGKLMDSSYNRGRRLDAKVRVTPCSFVNYSSVAAAADKQDWVVFVGRFESVKRPMLFVRAMPEILERHPNVRFKMVGWGDLDSDVRRAVTDANLAGVASVEYSPSPAQILAQSRIFVSLQVEDNYPSQSLLEAMACENAIVATDVGETAKLVDDSTGIRIRPDSSSLADAVCRLLSQPETLRTLGFNARQRVVSEHNIDRAVDYLAALHESVRPGNEN